MKAYIISLPKEIKRRENSIAQISKISGFDPEFVDAVNPREMDEKVVGMLFDQEKFQKRYGYAARPGEIGCTLSHQKCFRKIIRENLPYALILEDDFIIPSPDKLPLDVLENVISEAHCPCVVLLSGWYWYAGKRSVTDNYQLASVIDGYLTHAYVINKAAAEILVEERPAITADDWRYIRKKGVNLMAICPHLIDQQWNGTLPSAVNDVERMVNGNKLRYKIKGFCRSVPMRLCKMLNHFEPPVLE